MKTNSWPSPSRGTLGRLLPNHVTEKVALRLVILALAVLALLSLPRVSFAEIGAGALKSSTDKYNPTHYKAPAGTITAWIVGATDAAPEVDADGHIDVIIKSSTFGNQTVQGTFDPSTSNITFTFTVPNSGWCQTSSVSYGTNGHQANNSLITDGGTSQAGFAFVNGNGSLIETCSVPCDNVGPVISGDGVGGSTTIDCPATPKFSTPTAIDATDGDVSSSLTSTDVSTPGSCAGNYSVTRTWTATDKCGNSSTASQTINVQDATAPV